MVKEDRPNHRLTADAPTSVSSLGSSTEIRLCPPIHQTHSLNGVTVRSVQRLARVRKCAFLVCDVAVLSPSQCTHCAFTAQSLSDHASRRVRAAASSIAQPETRAVMKYSTPPGLCLRQCSKFGDQNFFATACQVQERDAPHSCTWSAGARESVACWLTVLGLAHLPRNTWLQSRLSSGCRTAIETVVTINTFVSTRSAVQLRAGPINGPVAFSVTWKREKMT